MTPAQCQGTIEFSKEFSYMVLLIVFEQILISWILNLQWQLWNGLTIIIKFRDQESETSIINDWNLYTILLFIECCSLTWLHMLVTLWGQWLLIIMYPIV